MIITSLQCSTNLYTAPMRSQIACESDTLLGSEPCYAAENNERGLEIEGGE